MENKITNLKKDKAESGGNFWTFDYGAIKTIAVEDGFDDERKTRTLNVIMHRPQGRYSFIVDVNAELLITHEYDILSMAAAQCLKSYLRKTQVAK